MGKLILWTLVSMLLLPWHASSQDSLKDPQAIEVLTRSALALGATQGAVSGVVASGTYTQIGKKTKTHTLRLKARGFDRIRWETDLEDGTVVTIIRDHFNGRVQQLGRTSTIPMSRASAATFEAIPVLALGDWLVSAAVKARYLGFEKVGGKDHHRVVLNRIHVGEAAADYKKAIEEITRVEFYVDPASSLPYWLRYYEPVGDWRGRSAIDLIYSDFKRVGTVTVPMTVGRYLNGQKISEIHFESIALNVTIPDSEF